MRKWFAALLAVSLLAGCAGTAPDTEPGAESGTETLPPLTATENAVAQVPLEYRVDIQAWEDTITSEDGTPLVHYAVEVPVLTLWRAGEQQVTEPQSPEEETALAGAEVFNEQFSDWRSGVDLTGLSEMAAEDLAFRRESGQAWDTAYELTLECELYRQGDLVSITGDYYTYTGAAHPNTYLLAWNFDLGSGSFLIPEHLALDSRAFLEAVWEEIVRQCGEVARENDLDPETFFWSDYQEIARDWSSYAVSFDETGMTVAFSPYELACYAAGSQTFSIPYALLEPYLSEQGRALLGLE